VALDAPVMLALQMRPAAAPAHVAAPVGAPQPMGPDTANTRYTGTLVKAEVTSHTALVPASTRSSSPRQPAEHHRLSRDAEGNVATSAHFEGSACIDLTT